MKTKKSRVKRGCQIFQIGLKKATSYEMVKGRLGYRFYNPDMLKSRMNMTPKEFQELTS